MKSLRKLGIMLLLLAAFGVLGTIGFHFIEGWSWFDSLYMVVITFSTVGYQEVHPLNHAGRIFTICLIFAGVGLVYFAIATITQLMLELELEKVFGRRRMEREMEKISDHYIVCGAGRVGLSAAREFSRNHVPFLIVETDPKKMEPHESGWLLMPGDATQEAILRQAHIERAIGLVAATTTDATNIYIVLTARALNPSLKIIARASEEGAEKHLKKAGADSVISPYAFAGHRIAQSFLRPHVVDFIDIAISRHTTAEMVIEEILVDPKSRLAGTTVGTSYIHRDMGIMVLAIKRSDGEPRFNPTANESIQAGDNLIVMGQAEKMEQLEAVAAARG